MSETIRDIDVTHGDDGHTWAYLSGQIVIDNSLDGEPSTFAARWICPCGALKTVHYCMVPADPVSAQEQGQRARDILDGEAQ